VKENFGLCLGNFLTIFLTLRNLYREADLSVGARKMINRTMKTYDLAPLSQVEKYEKELKKRFQDDFQPKSFEDRSGIRLQTRAALELGVLIKYWKNQESNIDLTKEAEYLINYAKRMSADFEEFKSNFKIPVLQFRQTLPVKTNSNEQGNLTGLFDFFAYSAADFKITMDARVLLGDRVQVLVGIVPLIPNQKGVSQNPFFYLPLMLINEKESAELYKAIEDLILPEMMAAVEVGSETWHINWFLIADLCSLWKMTELHWNKKEGFCLSSNCFKVTSVTSEVTTVVDRCVQHSC
jgi:hypothetical protein